MKRVVWCAAVALLLAGCGSKTPPGDPPDAIAKSAGISLPAATRLLYQENDPRAEAEGHNLWVLRSSEPFALKGDGVNIPAAEVRRAIAVHVSAGDLGEPAEPEGRSHEWKAGSARWRAYTLRTTAGHVLYLERYSGS